MGDFAESKSCDVVHGSENVRGRGPKKLCVDLA